MPNISRTVAVVIAAFAFFAGCATYSPKPLLPEKTARQFEDRSLDRPSLEKFIEKNLKKHITPWPPAKWDINTLSLAAFYYNPGLDTVRWRLQETRASVITAGERPNPSLSVSPEYVTNLSPDSEPWILGFSFDIPIETAGKRGYRIAEAKGNTLAARYALAEAAWKVRSALRGAMLDYFASTGKYNILLEQVRIDREALSVLKARLAAGEVSEPDVTRASVDYDRTFLLAGEEKSRLINTRANIASAIGVPVKALTGISFSLGIFRTPPPLESFSLPGLRQKALTNRPDILEALAQYEASQSHLQLEIAKQYPDLHIGPGYQYDQGQNKWGLGISLELPVLNHNQGPIAQAEAARARRAAHFRAIQDGIITDIERAVAGYGSSLERLKTADELVLEKGKSLSSLESMFNVGETDRLALLGGEIEYENARLLRLESLVKADRALGLLEDALEEPASDSRPENMP